MEILSFLQDGMRDTRLGLKSLIPVSRKQNQADIVLFLWRLGYFPLPILSSFVSNVQVGSGVE